MQLKGRAEPLDLAAVAVLSLIASAPLFFVSPGMGAFLGDGIVPLMKSLLPLLLLLPLPAAYVATVSRNRFRVETLGAAATLPLALLGLKFAAFSSGLILGLLLVSYKSRSLYKGDNQFWTFFKASAAVVTVMAVVLGLTAAYTYDSSADVRTDVQGNLTEKAVDTTTQFVDLSQSGLASGRLTGAATELAENVSRTSIALTELTVFRSVNASGTFSDSQRQLLRTAFSSSKQEIPARLRQESEQQVEEIFEGGGQEVDEEIIRSRASPIIGKFTEPTLPVLALIFFAVLSLGYVFKFPVALLGGIYGTVIYRLKQRGSQEENEAAPTRESRERRSR